ncbi:hypothetical protein Taro_044832 [Colocasia esculenta]|uniref:Uncharacterized protein n=1 Tax=Colocasia esculenta TaxID=4460 RepID=A0A843X1L0_COLES|nr:hypothetical protein [Colocasia esculenta]
MFQAPRQKMKKWSTSVDNRPGSTPNAGRSTLDGSPRRPILLPETWCRHWIISGRH